jgi:hypothetical protein
MFQTTHHNPEGNNLDTVYHIYNSYHHWCACGSVAVDALCYRPRSRRIIPSEVIGFFN